MKLPKKDFKGQKLCESCWNGCHYILDAVTKKKISNCLGVGCDCHCRELMAENHRRPKKDVSAQVNISEVVGDDVIQIGNREHRDEG